MLSLLNRILQTLLALVPRVLKIQTTLDAIRATQLLDSATLEQIRVTQQKDSATLANVLDLVEQIQDEITPGPAVAFIFTAIDEDGTTHEGVTNITMTDTQQETLSIQPVDKKGNPAPVDGAPVWLSSNTEVLTVTAAPDGLSATAVAVGPLGTATVSVTADADLGAGVTEIAGSIDITVVASAATTVKITEGAPTEQA